METKGNGQEPQRHLSEEKALGAFRKVPRTGVIYVMTEAAKHGYRPGEADSDEAWCNLGQGQPERMQCTKGRTASVRRRQTGQAFDGGTSDLGSGVLGNQAQQFHAVGWRQTVDKPQDHERGIHRVLLHLRDVLEQDMAVVPALFYGLHQALKRNVFVARQVRQQRVRRRLAEIAFEDQRSGRPFLRTVLPVGHRAAQGTDRCFDREEGTDVAQSTAQLATGGAQVP